MKRLKLVAKFAVSGVLVFLITRRVDWGTARQILADVDILALAFSTLLSIVMVGVTGWTYHVLTKGTVVALSVREAIRTNFIVRFYAMFLPGGVGAEVVRFLHVTQGRQGRLSFLVRIVVERSSFVLLTALSAVLGLLLALGGPQLASFASDILPLAAGAALLALSGMLLMSRTGFRLPLDRWAKSIVSLLPVKVGEQLSALNGMEQHRVGAGTVLRVLAIGLVWQLMYYARFYLLFVSVGLSLDFTDTLWISAVVLLLQSLPLSFAGIGVREGVLIFCVGLFGVANEVGFVIGNLFLAQMVFIAFVGAFLQFSERK